MRYYRIVITDTATGKTMVPDPVTRMFVAQEPGPDVSTYTSFANGNTLPGALNIEVDAPVAPMATPSGSAHIRVWGISLTEIGQSSNLMDSTKNGVVIPGKTIKVYAGMQKGLPLAKPSQSGLILSGKIFQAFGNWQGTEQTLEFIVTGGVGTNDAPKNIVLDWGANTELTGALGVALSTAFPNCNGHITININPKLKLNHWEGDAKPSLKVFAQYIKALTAPIIGGTYTGVDILMGDNAISVTDGTVPPQAIQIAFEDMIGQPTWIDGSTISVSFVMRSDISPGSLIVFPTGLSSPYVLTVGESAPPGSKAADRSVFQGKFLASTVHHYGNFRQADANSWVTVVNAAAPGS